MTDAPGRHKFCGPGQFVPGFSELRSAYASTRVSLANEATSMTKR